MWVKLFSEAEKDPVETHFRVSFFSLFISTLNQVHEALTLSNGHKV